MDSGATRTVCGEAVWNQISEYLLMRGMSDRITTKGENRDFRFGDGVCGPIKSGRQDTGLFGQSLARTHTTCVTRKHPFAAGTT